MWQQCSTFSFGLCVHLIFVTTCLIWLYLVSPIKMSHKTDIYPCTVVNLNLTFPLINKDMTYSIVIYSTTKWFHKNTILQSSKQHKQYMYEFQICFIIMILGEKKHKTKQSTQLNFTLIEKKICSRFIDHQMF